MTRPRNAYLQNKGCFIGELSPANPPLVCGPLAPGEICYMHPGGWNWGCFWLKEQLTPGRYTLQVTLTNHATGQTSGGNPVNIQPWMGSVTAPPMVVTIAEK